MFRYNILFLFIMGISGRVWGQEISFIATASSSKIGIKDRLQITFTINNINDLKDFHPQGFGDFTMMVGPIKQDNVNYSNNSHIHNISFIYIIKPNHEGTLTIPAAIVKDKAGHTYQSNVVTIQVVSGLVLPEMTGH